MPYGVWSGTPEELSARLGALRLLTDQWEQLDWPAILDVASLDDGTQRLLLNPSPAERAAAVLAMPEDQPAGSDWDHLHGRWGDVGRSWGERPARPAWVLCD